MLHRIEQNRPQLQCAILFFVLVMGSACNGNLSFQSRAVVREVLVSEKGRESFLQLSSASRVAQNMERQNTSDANPARWKTSATFMTHDHFGETHQFCKIEGACRLGDGTVLLPSWMEAHSHRMKRCGFEKVRYEIDDLDGNPIVKGKKGITTKCNFRNVDAVGNKAPPGERYLLASYLTPLILIIDMFKRPSVYQNVTRWSCVTEGGRACPIEAADSNATSFKPMILVDSRVSHTKDFMWPKSVLRLIRNSMEGELIISDLKDIYGWKIRSQALCFRSIISTNVRTMDFPPKTAILADHLFFSMNGLKRYSAERSRQHLAPCNVKVLVLNRYGKRFMEGASVLLRAISSYSRKLSKSGHQILVESEEVFFERSSFHEQVSIMQESDVIVVPHGEANSNFIFLRPKTKVFEIMPFGFSSMMYRNLSRAYGVTYESVRSQPDIEVFSSCVDHFNARNDKARKAFMKQWAKAGSEFTQETIQREANIDSNFSVAESDQGGLNMLEECVLYQRTSVDIRDLARKVVLAATDLCHLNVSLGLLE